MKVSHKLRIIIFPLTEKGQLLTGFTGEKTEEAFLIHTLSIAKPASLEDETNPDWVPSQNMRHSAQYVRKTYKGVERKARLDKRELSQNEPQSYMDIDFDNDEPRDGQETCILTRTDLVMEDLALKFEQLTEKTIS